MKVLTSPGAERPPHLVLIFGLGMLGSSIRIRLHDFQYRLSDTIDFSWSEESSWPHALDSILSYCLHHAPSPRRISIVWTAGVAGFACGHDEARRENESFLAVLTLARRLQDWELLERFDFHYMSSAGGLFEGQRFVSRDSVPCPVRPYGEMKLNQEGLLQDQLGTEHVFIYRPSSVYGPMVQKARHGLINNLVNDGLRGRTTILDAHVMALRDYVYFADIGNFTASRIRSLELPTGRGPTYFLVSSKCASIFEVVRIVERILHLKLRYRYDETFGNHSNITFGDSVLPKGWFPSSLAVGIRQFVAGKFASYAAVTRR